MCYIVKMLRGGTRACIAAICVFSAAAIAQPGAKTDILWDTYGVPHIFAPDEAGLARGYGWAQMHSHGNLILKLYGEARGRAAEYWGPEHLESDRWVRTMGAPSIAAEWLKAQSPAARTRLEAFTDGMNAYARAHAGRIDAGVKIVLPIRPEDVLAHNLRTIHFSFVARQQRVDQQKKDWKPATPGPSGVGGSNAWAIAPSRSASKRAMLLCNPHLPWEGFYLFFEAHLAAPGIDAYGASLIGSPSLGIAFNDYLGWSHTVNTHDGADLYELTLAEGGYRFDGRVRPFTTDQQTIRVRQADGSMRAEPFTVKRSVHGPVVEERGGKALALRVAGLDQPGQFEQYWAMLRARNFKEFEAAVSRLQMPMFTVIYADRDGRIMHLFGGRTPVRGSGDWEFWSGIVPGNASDTLWTRTHAYADLPRVVDPPSGWLQNANDPPWTTTFPLAVRADRFPSYMAPKFMHFRAQRSARMLDEDPSITFEEMIAYKHSSRMEMADRLLDDLLPLARSSPSARVKQAATVLEAWDRSADAQSRGAVLFEAFAREWTRGPSRGTYATKWSESSPRVTPDGFADPAEAVRALEAAAATLQKDNRPLDVAWGDVYRLRRGALDLPANGGPDNLGIFRVVGYRRSPGGQFEAAGGDSFVAAIEFGPTVRARALMSYGNSSQPGSPHQSDQLELFAKNQLRTVWKNRKEIETNLSRREVLSQ